MFVSWHTHIMKKLKCTIHTAQGLPIRLNDTKAMSGSIYYLSVLHYVKNRIRDWVISLLLRTNIASCEDKSVDLGDNIIISSNWTAIPSNDSVMATAHSPLSRILKSAPFLCWNIHYLYLAFFQCDGDHNTIIAQVLSDNNVQFNEIHSRKVTQLLQILKKICIDQSWPHNCDFWKT